MKALSIKQPWAEAILQGVKKVENRTWQTTHRGPLVLHTGKKLDRQGYCWLRARQIKDRGDPLFQAANAPSWPDMPWASEYTFGAYLGVIEIVGIAPQFMPGAESDPWRDTEQFGWQIGRVVRFGRPVPGIGRQGLWHVPPVIAGHAHVAWTDPKVCG